MESEHTRVPHYKAFISYSHADNSQAGRQWADWLHHALETYQVPQALVGQTNQYGQEVPARIYPVFQDEKELSANANLNASLQNALDRSEFLIYLSSPRSAQSVYVQEEIKHFKQTGKGDKIIALILRGEPEYGQQQTEQQCFPDALRFGVNAEGLIDYERHEEVLAADVRLPHSSEEGFTSSEHYRRHLQQQRTPGAKIKQKTAEYEERLNLAKLKIISTLLGVPLAELTQRDHAYQLERMKRKNRNIKRVAGIVSVLALIAAAAGVYAWQQKNLSQQRLAQSLYASGISKLAQNEYGEPAAYIAAAVRNGSDNASQFAESMLAVKDDRVLLPDMAAANTVFSPNGQYVAGFADKGNSRFVLQLWNARTRQPITEIKAISTHAPGKPVFDHEQRVYVLNGAGEVVRYQPDTGQTQVLYRSEKPDSLQLADVSPDGRWLAIRRYDTNSLDIISSEDSAIGLSRPVDLNTTSLVAFSPDSQQALIWQQGDNRSQGDIVQLHPTGPTTIPFTATASAGQVRFATDGRQLLLFGSRSLILVNSHNGSSQILNGQDGPYVWADFNADGKTLLAVGGSGYAVYQRDNGRLKTNGLLPLNNLRRSLETDATRSPDQTQQITTLNKQSYLQNLGNNNLLISDLHLPPQLRQIVADHSGSHWLVLMPDGKSIDRIDIETHARQAGQARLPEEAAYVRVLDDDLLMAVSPQKNVRFYNPVNGQEVGKVVATQARMININHDRSQFLARTGDSSFGIWNIRDGSEVLNYQHPQALGNFTTDEAFKYLLVTNDKQWQLLDLSSHQVLLSGNEGLTNGVFSPDGRWLAVAKASGQTDVYRLGKQRLAFSLPTVATPILRFSPDGEVLLASHDTKRLRLWHTEDGRAYGQAISVMPKPKLLEFSADSRRLFVQDYTDGQLTPSVKIIDTGSGSLMALPLASGNYNTVQLVDAGKRIASVEMLPDNSQAQIWQVPGDLNLPQEQLATDLEAFYGRKYNPQTGTIDAYQGQRQFTTWYFQNIYTRPVAPNAKTTVVTAIESLTPVANSEALQQLGSVYYYHPLAKAALAQHFGKQADTQALAAFLAQLAQRQLARVDDNALKLQTQRLLAPSTQPRP